jgi:hypothetical protein
MPSRGSTVGALEKREADISVGNAPAKNMMVTTYQSRNEKMRMSGMAQTTELSPERDVFMV